MLGEVTGRNRAPAPEERRRDAERTRDRIIAAAVEEFAAKGYAGARVSEIAARATVNKQLISYYFGGKEGLYREAAEQWRTLEAERAEPVTLPEMFASYVATDEQTRLFVRMLAWDGLADSPDNPDTDATRERMRHALADLHRRQEAGEFAADIDPACLLLVSMAAAAAPVTLAHIARTLTDDDPDTFARHYADQLARIVTHLAPRR
jgi:TetR/AcrR family transcriptional regulator